MKRLLAFVCGFALSSPALPAATYLGGTIVDITSGASGLFVRLDTGVPDNCVGTPFGWLLIPQTSKVMVAVTLIARIQNVPVVVYTSGIDSSGYCVINQLDPAL